MDGDEGTVETDMEPTEVGDPEVCAMHFVEQNDEYGTWEPMTAENCHTENWSTEKDDNAPAGFMAKIRAYFKAVSVWIRLVVEKLRSLIAPKAD